MNLFGLDIYARGHFEAFSIERLLAADDLLLRQLGFVKLKRSAHFFARVDYLNPQSAIEAH
jgi:hypothetical protein